MRRMWPDTCKDRCPASFLIIIESSPLLYMSVPADVLRTHIDYTTWASMRLLDAAAQLSPEELTHDFQTADGSVLDTLAHIFAADRLWLARLAGGPHPGFVTDADRSLDALQNGWPALMDRWKTWAADLTDDEVRGEIAYRNMKGRPWKQPLWQLILHVVNHGTHHRGQVSGLLRTLGHTPPTIDLVYFYGQR
jgi:uncharacterized damage-inducible protein DinB